jgi:hypothetical protein
MSYPHDVCSLRDCDQPADPPLGPFCKDHTWEDYRMEIDAIWESSAP